MRDSCLYRRVGWLLLSLIAMTAAVYGQGPCGGKPCPVMKSNELRAPKKPPLETKPTQPVPSTPKTVALAAIMVESNVPNTSVTINGQPRGATDSNGHFVIDSLMPGIYTVSAAKRGYATEERLVTLSEGHREMISLLLAPLTPKPLNELQLGTSNYKAVLTQGNRSIPISVRIDIREERDSWVATETAETLFGKIVDISIIEKVTLVLKRRSISQGPMITEVTYKGTTAAGVVNVNGQSRPIAVELDGLVFADGAGAYDVIACLPLAPEYSTTFHNFDVQKQNQQLKQLKVVGAESVTVPAGIFDAYKVELSVSGDESEKQTVWISKKSRKVVKVVANVPSLGAVLTSELQ